MSTLFIDLDKFHQIISAIISTLQLGTKAYFGGTLSMMLSGGPYTALTIAHLHADFVLLRD